MKIPDYLEALTRETVDKLFGSRSSDVAPTGKAADIFRHEADEVVRTALLQAHRNGAFEGKTEA